MKLRTSINRFLGRSRADQQHDRQQHQLSSPTVHHPHIEVAVSNYAKLLNHFDINVILDVGANAGQYATRMFEMGFAGNVISFEPLSAAFEVLDKAARHRTAWQTVNIALGSRNETAQINIANNSYSSSLLDMLDAHLQSAPESAYIGQEQIKVRTLDSVYDQYCSSNDRVFLKIDTQGFEKHVLDGALESLGKIVGIQLEMSLIPLYRDEMLLRDMLAHLESLGYHLYHLEHGFTDAKTGRLLQVDGMFFRD